MNRWRAGLVLVFAVFGSNCHQAPASTKHYELGSVYTYDYVLGMELNEPSGLEGHNGPSGSSSGDVRTGSTVGYKILSQVEVKPIWQSEPGGSILEIQLVKPHLQIKSRIAPQPEGFRDHSSNLDTATLHPLFVHWKDGQIHGTFSVQNDDTSMVNIKKGIANILQIHPGEGGEIEENTPAGKCRVKYDIGKAFHVKKTISERCDFSGSDYSFRTHNNPVLGSEIESEINATITMSRDTGVVDEAEVQELHVVRVTAKKEVGARVQASQSFKLAGTSSSNNIFKASNVEAAVKEIAKAKGVQLVSDNLLPKQEKIPLCEAINCKTYDILSQSLTTEGIATTKMASAFIQMVSKFREAKMQEIEPLVKPNLRIFPQILDICAAAGTYDIHQVVMKALNFHSEDETTNPERYLLGLSLSASPAPEVLQDLFKLMKRTVPSAQLQEALILTTAAVAHTLAESNRKANLPQSRLVLEIEEYLTNSLTSCSGEDIGLCQQLYLRSLKNLKSKSSIPLLFEILLKNSVQKTSVVAMKTIHSMPDAFIDSKYRPTLIKIINQLGKKYDSSVRTLALDVILRNSPTKDELRNIVKALLEKVVDKQHAEVTTFMWSRLHEFMENNPILKNFLEEIIIDEQMKNYHHLSPRGLSTAFSRVFTANPSGNSTFSNSIEMSGKVLKRSLFDVFIRSQKHALPLLSLGIFAEGLASFASEGTSVTDTDDEEEDATAGMELSLMGVQTRPLVFFVGKGTLMGMIWSGTGSERTSALKGNVLLQDEKQVIPLYNGLVAEVNIQGGISFDLAGSAEVSLWHRTAKSLVENKAGVVLQSVVRADTSFVRSRVDYTVAAEATLHFSSDINFYDGVVMCLKLTQPGFVVKQNIHKIERIPGSKHKLRKAKYKTLPIPGITYALNKKNSELCGVMYKDEL